MLYQYEHWCPAVVARLVCTFMQIDDTCTAAPPIDGIMAVQNRLNMLINIPFLTTLNSGVMITYVPIQALYQHTSLLHAKDELMQNPAAWSDERLRVKGVGGYGRLCLRSSRGAQCFLFECDYIAMQLQQAPHCVRPLVRHAVF